MQIRADSNNDETVENSAVVGEQNANLQIGEANKKAFGRVRFGSRKLPALPVALMLGIGLAVLVAAIAAFALPGHVSFTTKLSANSVYFSPVFVVVVWMLLVDSTSIRGARKNAEENVETTWAYRAGWDTFLVTLMTAWPVAIATVDVKSTMPMMTLTLLGTMSFMGVVYCLAYFWESRHRG